MSFQKEKHLPSPAGWAIFFIYGALLVGLFYSSHSVMISWWNRDDYNYCYLIPFIFLYLIWEKRGEISQEKYSPTWLGIIPFVVGIVFYWIGELGGEYFALYLSSWLVFVGLCWLHTGWKKLKIILFPLFFLLTMFPLPNFLYNKVSVNLKLISSLLGVEMMRLSGMSAFREGNIIDLGFTQLQVVDACSGLRYLIPLIVLGLLLAYFFKAAVWKKIVLVLSTIPLSIFTNALRIASVGVLYQFWGPAVAEGFFHDFSGWFIFMATLGFLLIEMWILKKVLPEPSDIDAGKQEELPDGSTASTKLEDPYRRQKRTLLSSLLEGLLQPHFIVAVFLLGTTLVLSQGIEFREKIPISKSFNNFPLQVGEWQGSSQTMEQKFLDELDLNDYVIIDYKDSQGRNVNFYVAYYESQRKGESIHSPATCLPGSGWLFNQSGTETIPVAAYGNDSMQVNRAFMQKGNYRQLSYYWFPQRGRILTNAYQLKMFTFWDALTRQRTDGALVRVITPVYQNEELKDAEARLQSFTSEIQPVLSEFIPE